MGLNMSVELHDQTLLKVMKTENEGREYSVSFRAIVAQSATNPGQPNEVDTQSISQN